MSEQSKADYSNFLATQEGIYDKFRATSHEVGVTRGLEKDTKGTAPQGAFLVALRYPEAKMALAEEFSQREGSLRPGTHELVLLLSRGKLRYRSGCTGELECAEHCCQCRGGPNRRGSVRGVE